ncbi:ABC-2 type transport system ATP-binding protein [Paenibacillaceae bacterium GAS479]|nr:ABC-2 type transport system ATP-binding protein [Paenibacillaceae bacterium GAS479]
MNKAIEQAQGHMEQSAEGNATEASSARGNATEANLNEISLSEKEPSSAVTLRSVIQKRSRFKLGPLTLDVPTGYVTAIVGPNGSGKSSTFRLLMDQSRPDEGEVWLLGEPVGTGLDDSLLKQRIGYVPEEDNKRDAGLRGTFKADFTSEWYPSWNANEFERLLREFEVEPSLRLGKMSKGMRRKYELALAMALGPDLLLLDEPSSGLDPISWRKLVDELHRYMRRGSRTILMATHIMDEVKRLADYIVIMAGGKIIGMYEKDELLSSWHTFYVGPATSRLSAHEAGAAASIALESVQALPGLVNAEEAGGGTCRVTTCKAWEAELWCRQQGFVISGQRALELDEIMVLLIRDS